MKEKWHDRSEGLLSPQYLEAGPRMNENLQGIPRCSASALGNRIVSPASAPVERLDDQPMADIDPNKNLNQLKCSFCPRSFPTKIGGGVHERKVHPVEANEQISENVESCGVVSEEMAEAEAELRNVKYMNKHLMDIYGKMTSAELNRI